MRKEPLMISVCNQKGGIGKSTFNTLVASYYHYLEGRNCLVVDCDYPQWSIYEQRNRELAIVEKSNYYKLQLVRQFKQNGQKLWPIINTTPHEALDAVKKFLQEDTRVFDVVLFDLPGTINTNGVVQVLSVLDYIFVPMKADKMVMESSVNFAKMINENLVLNNQYKTKGVFMFWTMIDKRERTPLYDQYEKVLDVFALQKMETHIPYRSRFNKEILLAGDPVSRSTVFPSDKTFLADSMVEELAKEIGSILKFGQ